MELISEQWDGKDTVWYRLRDEKGQLYVASAPYKDTPEITSKFRQRKDGKSAIVDGENLVLRGDVVKSLKVQPLRKSVPKLTGLDPLGIRLEDGQGNVWYAAYNEQDWVMKSKQNVEDFVDAPAGSKSPFHYEVEGRFVRFVENAQAFYVVSFVELQEVLMRQLFEQSKVVSGYAGLVCPECRWGIDPDNAERIRAFCLQVLANLEVKTCSCLAPTPTSPADTSAR